MNITSYIMVLIDLPNVTIGKKSIIDRSPHKNSFFVCLRQLMYVWKTMALHVSH